MSKKSKRAVVILYGKEELAEVLKKVLTRQLEDKRRNNSKDNKN